MVAEEKVNKVLGTKGFLPSSWTVDNLKSVVGSLKRDGDEKLPSRRNDLLDRLYKTAHTRQIQLVRVVVKPLPVQHSDYPRVTDTVGTRRHRTLLPGEDDEVSPSFFACVICAISCR